MRNLAEALTEITGARRASIWQRLPSGQRLYCREAYDEASGEHLVGIQLHRSELPKLFALLDETEDLTVLDAAVDPRAAEFHRTMMRPAGTTRFCIVPVRAAGALLGCMLLEDPTETEGVRAFLDFIASLLALRLRAAAETQA